MKLEVVARRNAEERKGQNHGQPCRGNDQEYSEREPRMGGRQQCRPHQRNRMRTDLTQRFPPTGDAPQGNCCLLKAMWANPHKSVKQHRGNFRHGFVEKSHGFLPQIHFHAISRTTRLVTLQPLTRWSKPTRGAKRPTRETAREPFGFWENALDSFGVRTRGGKARLGGRDFLGTSLFTKLLQEFFLAE